MENVLELDLNNTTQIDNVYVRAKLHAYYIDNNDAKNNDPLLRRMTSSLI